MGLLQPIRSAIQRVNQRQAHKRSFMGMSESPFLLNWSGHTKDIKPRDLYTQSVSHFAVFNWRAELLAALPLRLYRIIERDGLRGTARYRQQQTRYRRYLNTLQPFPSLFKRAMDAGDLEEVTTGALYDMLALVNSSRNWTVNRLWNMTVQSMDLFGQAGWALEKKGRLPVEIWWKSGEYLRVMPDRTTYIKGYVYDDQFGVDPQTFAPDELIWFANANPLDEYSGISPLRVTGIYGQHEYASMQSNQRLHEQGLMLGGIVTPAGDLQWNPKQAREIEEDLTRRFAGKDKAHQWGAFRHAVSVHSLGTSPRDAEFLEGMGWDLEAVARGFRWPLDLLGGRRTYENVDAAMEAAYTFSILPLGRQLASDLVEQLLPIYPNQDGVDLISFDASEVSALQEAETAQWDRVAGQLDRGVTFINEYRHSLGLEPLPWGNVWWRAGGPVSGSESDEPGEELAEEPPRSASRAWEDIETQLQAEVDAYIRDFEEAVPRAKGLLTAKAVRAVWNETEKQFFDHKGDPISWADINRFQLNYEEHAVGRMRVRAAQLAASNLSISEMREAIRYELRQLYTVNYLMGMGGVKQMGFMHWGSLGAMLRQQYRYLDVVLDAVLAGTLNFRDTEAVMRRLSRFGKTAYQAYSKGRAKAYGAHIDLPAHPRDGSTPCMFNCGCYWAIRQSEHDITFTWKRGLLDSCKVCIKREQEWKALTFVRLRSYTNGRSRISAQRQPV